MSTRLRVDRASATGAGSSGVSVFMERLRTSPPSSSARVRMTRTAFLSVVFLFSLVVAGVLSAVSRGSSGLGTFFRTAFLSVLDVFMELRMVSYVDVDRDAVVHGQNVHLPFLAVNAGGGSEAALDLSFHGGGSGKGKRVPVPKGFLNQVADSAQIVIRRQAFFGEQGRVVINGGDDEILPPHGRDGGLSVPVLVFGGFSGAHQNDAVVAHRRHDDVVGGVLGVEGPFEDVAVQRSQALEALNDAPAHGLVDGGDHDAFPMLAR
nr:MAG TPA: hypothetical protein [Caudoviricetes sp.]